MRMSRQSQKHSHAGSTETGRKTRLRLSRSPHAVSASQASVR